MSDELQGMGKYQRKQLAKARGQWVAPSDERSPGMMTEQERKALDRLSLKLSDAYKKISKLSLGQEVPRRLQDILCSATFHLGIAMRQYKSMLADNSLDAQNRKKLQGQEDDCRDLLDLFRFIHVPDKEDAAPATI